jgi:phage gp45-like
MKVAVPLCVFALALSVPLVAQDRTTKSRTGIKAHEGRAVAMTGCLRGDALSNGYTLVGTMSAAGHSIKSKSKVKTDIDKHDRTVKANTKTSVDDGVVATTGAMTTFALVPGNGVDLSPHVGQQVQISAVMVEPGHRDADVKIKDKTTIDREHAPDTSARSERKVEVPHNAHGQWTVVSVKPLGSTCPAQ